MSTFTEQDMESLRVGLAGFLAGMVLMGFLCFILWQILAAARERRALRDEAIERYNGPGPLRRFVGGPLAPNEDALAFDAGHQAVKRLGVAANPYAAAYRAITTLHEAWQAGANVAMAEREGGVR